MHVNGCQWTLFALTRWCGNKHGGHKWPRCLAAFANLGHLCTCRTSSLSPSQLRLKCSCSSWFSQRKPVMVCLNLEDAPKSWYPVADLGAENEAWDFEPLDVGVAIFERTPVVKEGWVGQGCSRSGFGYGTVKRMWLLIFSFICHCFKEIWLSHVLLDKIVISKLKKKHGMNGKLMTKTVRSISIPRQSHWYPYIYRIIN